MVRQRQLEVVDVEVEPDKHDADGGVERRARRDGRVVVRGHLAPQGRVGAADVGVAFGGKLGFDASFAKDEDRALGGREGEDPRDVDRGRVGGAEDFFLLGGGGGWSRGWRTRRGRWDWRGKGRSRGGKRARRGQGDVTYHLRGDAHGIEFFLVVGPGFGAVVCDEDDLFA